jgi:hypothetical protein
MTLPHRDNMLVDLKVIFAPEVQHRNMHFEKAMAKNILHLRRKKMCRLLLLPTFSSYGAVIRENDKEITLSNTEF